MKPLLSSVTRVGDDLLAIRETDEGDFLHDVSIGKDIRRLPNGPNGKDIVLLSPDRKTGVLPLGTDKNVVLVDLSTGRSMEAFEGESFTLSLAFSRDGKTSLTGDLTDGKRLVSGGDDSTALVWDVAEALAGRGP